MAPEFLIFRSLSGAVEPVNQVILFDFLLKSYNGSCSCWVVWLLDFPGVGLIEERSRNASLYNNPKINHLSMGGLKEESLSKS